MSIIRHFRAQPLLCAMCTLILVLTMSIPTVHADKSEKRRQKIDKREQETMQRLFKEKPRSKQLYHQSYGYAVFYGTQTALLISGGSGKGVAINKKTGERVYMGMLAAGIGIGLGIQVLYTVFLFEEAEKFQYFVDKGWNADASASAVAATEGVNADSSFRDGVMVYQLTDKGLIVQASIKGTKYWRSKKLNKK
ncbi:MAG: hypothetical protein O7G88_18865 [bacterium]|nr:hypothetical protein [bacterium]